MAETCSVVLARFAAELEYTKIPADVVRAKLKLTPEDIEAIELRVPGPAVSILCEPFADKLRPANSYTARFSLPYAVAVVLAQGYAGIDDFSDERIRDPRILALAARMTYQIDDTLPFSEHFPGWVRLRLRDGRQVEERMDVSRGSRQHPMTEAEFHEKFESNAGRPGDGLVRRGVSAAGKRVCRSLSHRLCFRRREGPHRSRARVLCPERDGPKTALMSATLLTKGRSRFINGRFPCCARGCLPMFSSCFRSSLNSGQP